MLTKVFFRLYCDVWNDIFCLPSTLIIPCEKVTAYQLNTKNTANTLSYDLVHSLSSGHLERELHSDISHTDGLLRKHPTWISVLSIATLL